MRPLYSLNAFRTGQFCTGKQRSTQQKATTVVDDALGEDDAVVEDAALTSDALAVSETEIPPEVVESSGGPAWIRTKNQQIMSLLL
jgi:hypothetical protein